MTANPATKACKKCGEVKPLTKFCRVKVNRDGRSGTCNSCRNRQLRALNTNSPEYRARRKAQRRKPETREKARRWREANRDKIEEAWMRYADRNGEKLLAHQKVRSAVRSGQMIKPDRCETCGEEVPRARLHGHHDDYDRPLDVRWLCPSCHGAHHAEERQAALTKAKELAEGDRS
jgi:formylmethanofuran dehydrogenase subunit E